jgi:hypothetical protein
MIDVKSAVKIARDYLTDFYPEGLSNLMLEEVELSNDEQYWLITFGFDTDRLAAEPLADVLTKVRPAADYLRPKYVRDYKIIKLRAEDGKPVSMKIREV